MSKRCVAAGCSNVSSENISLFSFPSEQKLKDEWVKRVRRTRDKWVPTKYSVLCSAHFSEDCFDTVPSLKEALGCPVQHRNRQKPDAVPTIFKRTLDPAKDNDPEAAKPRRQAAEKLARKREVSHLLKKSSTTTVASEMELHQPLEEFLEERDVLSESVSTQTTRQPGMHRSVLAQVNIRPKGTIVRSKGVQTTAHLKDKTTQTECEQEPNFSAKFSKQPSLPSEFESDLSSSPYQEPENKDEDFIPSETPESESTPASSETDTGKSSRENKDDFYIISWTHLLMLLQLWACKCCGEKQQHIQRVTRGTMLQVVFVCSRCSNQSKWNSQGYTGNIPTGNILLSSAIMASGALFYNEYGHYL